jgi:hypothetical protein
VCGLDLPPAEKSLFYQLTFAFLPMAIFYPRALSKDMRAEQIKKKLPF